MPGIKQPMQLCEDMISTGFIVFDHFIKVQLAVQNIFKEDNQFRFQCMPTLSLRNCTEVEQSKTIRFALYSIIEQYCKESSIALSRFLILESLHAHHRHVRLIYPHFIMCWPFVNDSILEHRSKLLIDIANGKRGRSAYLDVPAVLFPTCAEIVGWEKIPRG